MQRVEILSDRSFNAIVTSNGLVRARSVISAGEEIILSTYHADKVNYFDCMVVESPELTSKDGSKFGKISGYSFVQGNWKYELDYNGRKENDGEEEMKKRLVYIHA